MPATLPALTAELPARVVDEAELDRSWRRAGSLDELSVGDRVAVYSRGRTREALVEKIGRKNATAIYTTEGALADAAKIAGFTSVARLEGNIANLEALIADYLELAGDKPDSERIPTHSNLTAKGARMLAESSREALELERERLELLTAGDRDGFLDTFVNSTRKSAAPADIFVPAGASALKAEAGDAD